MKKLISLLCVLSLLFCMSFPVYASDQNLAETANEEQSVSYAPINNNTNYQEMLFTASDVAGAATVKLRAIGNGLVDADWSVVMSKGRISKLFLDINIKYGYFYNNIKTLSVNRYVSNWSSAQYGTEQSSWSKGTTLKVDLGGTVEINGMYDYPVSSYDYGVTTVK